MPDSLLTPDQRKYLIQLSTEAPTDWLRLRALILLLYDDGQYTRQVAASVGRSRGRVRYWKRQFRLRGMSIFSNPPKQGQPILTKERKGMETSYPPSSELNSAAPADTQETQDSKDTSLPLADRDNGPQQPVVTSEPPSPPTELSPESSQGPETDAILNSLKTVKSPGMLPEDTLAEAGRKVLCFHFAEMLRHEAGTRLGEDIEELHDMRVATRRMRAAFEIFNQAFKPKVLKLHLKGLRKAGRTLGRARDLDVFVEKASRYEQSLPEGQREGLAPLLQSWEQQRIAARQNLVAYLDSPEYEEFKVKFYRFVTTPGAGVPALPADVHVPTRVREIAPILIYSQLAAVRAYGDLLSNATLEQFHALRIEFKKIRYTIEFFREVLGEEAKTVINDLKGLQDHLGDLNDAQVATQILSEFLSGWDTRQGALPVGIRQNPEPVVAYLAYQHAERFRLMTTFFDEAWACFDRPEFRRNLALAVSVL